MNKKTEYNYYNNSDQPLISLERGVDDIRIKLNTNNINRDWAVLNFQEATSLFYALKSALNFNSKHV
jgi:hypothetical protein